MSVYHIEENCCDRYSDKELLFHNVVYGHDFSVELLAWAIQQSFTTITLIETYLKKYDAETVQSKLRMLVHSILGECRVPILFFAVECNSPQLVSLLCRFGAGTGDRAYPSGLPVLAYSVIRAEYDVSDTTETLIALLAAGASSTDIPKDMWQPYIEPPKITEPQEKKDGWGKRKVSDWCTNEVRKALCRSLTLIQCYYLWKTTLIPATTAVRKQVTGAYDIQDLFQIHYYIIGQFQAAQEVIQSIISHYAVKLRKPLVLLFAGSSGHGKTELANRTSSLLNVDILQVDCAEMQNETDLFGPKPPYSGHKEASALNKFLVGNAGARSVVFLDEIDKTTDEVRQALLLTLDSGIYRDRIDNKKIDCSKTIWIMAANHGEELIKKYWEGHLQDLPEERHEFIHLSPPFKALRKNLKRAFANKFGSPLSGRITSVIPFLPFTVNERAVVASTFIRQLRNEVRKKIDVDANEFIRRVHLNLVDEWQIAKHLVKEGYEQAEGARSLGNEVYRQITLRLVNAFLNGNEPIKDETDETKPLVKFDVRVDDEMEDFQDFQVERNGLTTLQFRDTT